MILNVFFIGYESREFRIVCVFEKYVEDVIFCFFLCVGVEYERWVRDYF